MNSKKTTGNQPHHVALPAGSELADQKIDTAGSAPSSGIDEWFEKLVDEKDRVKMGARIRSCRERIGLSQEAMGRRLLHSKQFMSSIETGKTEVHRLMLIGMARLFGVSLDYLITGAGEPPNARRALLSPLVSAGSLLAEGSLDQLFERQTGGELSVWVRVDDEGLAPHILATDLVLVDPDRAVLPGDIVAVHVPRTKRIWVRRFAPLDALSSAPPYRLLADCDVYPPLEVHNADAPQMLGPALQLIRTEALGRGQ